MLPPHHAGRRGRLAAIPVILLILALVIPVPTVSASGPALKVSGVPVAGRHISVVGTGFGPRVRLQLRWDGRSAGMPVVRTDARGRFSTSIVVPARATVGSHRVSVVTAGKATLRTRTLVVRTIGVVAAQATTPGTPSATPTPTPTPTSSLVISAVSAYNITQTGATITWTVSAPATGQVEYGPTSAYGSLSLPETSFTYTTHIQDLSGLAPGTLYHYRTHSVDAAGNVAYSGDSTFTTLSGSATPTPAPTATPTLTSTSTAARASGGLYGPGIGADGLANTQVGGTSCGCANLMSAYRFRASQSSALSGIRIYIIGTVSGYAAGTGGTLNVSVQTDDGSAQHLPSGTVLAATSIPNAATLEGFPFITFGSPATLVAGQLYHIVFRNTDPAPTSNFVSIDGLYVSPPVLTPRQAEYSDTDWAQLMNAGDGWQIRPEFTPILELVFANGAADGVGYMETWVRSPKTISGVAQARETFTVSGGNRSVSSVSLRLKRVSGSSPLQLGVETASGTLVAQTTIPASSISTNDYATWATAMFTSPFVLTNGQAYHLVVSSSADTSYSLFVIRKGVDYGFDPVTYFADGSAQYNPGTGWVAFDNGSSGPLDEGDLQFYFR